MNGIDIRKLILLFYQHIKGIFGLASIDFRTNFQGCLSQTIPDIKHGTIALIQSTLQYVPPCPPLYKVVSPKHPDSLHWHRLNSTLIREGVGREGWWLAASFVLISSNIATHCVLSQTNLSVIVWIKVKNQKIEYTKKFQGKYSFNG